MIFSIELRLKQQKRNLNIDEYQLKGIYGTFLDKTMALLTKLLNKPLESLISDLRAIYLNENT
jgi:hypothetical protein